MAPYIRLYKARPYKAVTPPLVGPLKRIPKVYKKLFSAFTVNILVINMGLGNFPGSRMVSGAPGSLLELFPPNRRF